MSKEYSNTGATQSETFDKNENLNDGGTQEYKEKSERDISGDFYYNIEWIRKEISIISRVNEDDAEYFKRYLNIILKDYNKESEPGTLIGALSVLKDDIEEYKKKYVVERNRDIQLEYIRDSIKKLYDSCNNMSGKECAVALLKIRGDFFKIENVPDDKKRGIDSEMFKLLFSFISRAVRENKGIKLETILDKDVKNGLETYIYNNRIAELQKSEYEEDTTNYHELYYYMTTNPEYIFSNEFWQIMNRTMDTIHKREKEEKKELSMILNEKESKLAKIIEFLKNKNPFKKKKQNETKEPNNSPSIDDLKLIDKELLSSQITDDFLMEMENERLRKEKKEADKVYISQNREIPIFTLINNNWKIADNIMYSNLRNDKYKVTYDYIDKKGIEKQIIFDDGVIKIKVGGRIYWTDVNLPELVDSIEYAILLDRLFGTNYRNLLIYDIEGYCRSEGEFKCGEKASKRLKKYSRLYRNINESYKKIESECKDSMMDVIGLEEQKRAKFYKSNGFKAQMQNSTSNSKKDVLSEAQNSVDETEQKKEEAVGDQKNEEK